MNIIICIRGIKAITCKLTITVFMIYINSIFMYGYSFRRIIKPVDSMAYWWYNSVFAAHFFAHIFSYIWEQILMEDSKIDTNWQTSYLIRQPALLIISPISGGSLYKLWAATFYDKDIPLTQASYNQHITVIGIWQTRTQWGTSLCSNPSPPHPVWVC